MKLQSTLVLGSLPFIYADEIQVQSPLTQAASLLLPTFIDNTAFENNLLEHGCWCAKLSPTAIQMVLGGKVASDALDEICKKWITTRSCTQVSSGSCYNVDRQSGSHQYTVSFTSGLSDAVCTDSDQCLSESCQVDLHFMNQIKQYFVDNGDISPVTNPTCAVYDGNHVNPGHHAHCDAVDAITTTTAPAPVVTVDPCVSGANYNPQAADFAVGGNQERYAGYTQVPSNFVRSVIGGVLMNKFQDAGFNLAMLHSQQDVGFCSICTSDNYEVNLGFSYVLWSWASDATWNANFCNGVSHATDTTVTTCSPNGCGNVDWSQVSADNAWADEYCGDASEVMNGLYVKTSIYQTFSSCNYAAVRMVQARSTVRKPRN